MRSSRVVRGAVKGVAVVVLAGTLAGCGNGTSESSSPSTDLGWPASRETAEPKLAWETPSADPLSTPAATASAAPSETPSESDSGTTDDAEEQGRYADPTGTYTIAIPPTWKEAGMESPKAWYVRPSTGAGGSNLSMMIEKIPAGISLREYVDLSLRNAPELVEDFALRSSGPASLDSGQEAIRWSYSGRFGSSGKLRFLAYIAVEDDSAVVATFTTRRWSASLEHEVEQVMRTIELTSD